MPLGRTGRDREPGFVSGVLMMGAKWNRRVKCLAVETSGWARHSSKTANANDNGKAIAIAA